MFLQRLFLGIFAIPLLASLWSDKKKSIIPPQTHIPPTEENTDTLDNMIRRFPCEESDLGGVLYEIPDGVDMQRTCVPSAPPIEI